MRRTSHPQRERNDTPRAIGLVATIHASPQQAIALAICVVFTIVALIAVRFGSMQGPEIKPFLPMVATVWALADLMTAFLLLGQFYLNGSASYSVLAAAYAVSGLLTWPYLLAFPGLFDTGTSSVAVQQISIWLWSIWHASFPAIVTLAALYDPGFTRRIASRRALRYGVWITVSATIAVVAGLTAFVYGERAKLPILIFHGHLEAGFTHVVALILATLNLLGCVVLLRPRRRLTSLQLWLSVAMFTAMLDCLLNSMSVRRYSYGWDIGKIETVMTASVVLAVLLCEVTRSMWLQKVHEVVLEKSEARYRSMANAMPQIAFTATGDGRVDYINERWIAYTGLSLEESMEHGALTVTHPDDRESAAAAWASAMTCGRVFEAEQRLRRAADGLYRWHLMRAVPIHDADGPVLQWFGTGTDIDDQKRAEAEISEARDEALRAATVKSAFVATMSHEIRTPMSGVVGMNELLLLTTLTDEQRNYATVARDSGQLLLRVINDILDFSKIEAGKLDLESVPFEPASQVGSIVALLQRQFDEKGVRLSARIDAHVPDSVIGDPGRLRQILMNVVGNALKFTPADGHVEVEVGVASTKTERPSLHFNVRDTGIGIEPHVQSRLFEPFSQADAATTRKFGGTGLGLSICKQLVTLMGGAIGVESVAGAGACFWFSIPLVRGHGSRDIRADAQAGAERRASVRSRTEKILLVDDNDVNVMLAKLQLKRLGFEVTTASNGVEACRAAQSTCYDLILMDCHMPEMDGFAAARKIRECEAGTTRRVPIVAMTADAQSSVKDACLAAGMSDYVSKPSTIASLDAIFERWLPATLA